MRRFKLPSVARLAAGTSQVAQRFPWTVLAALTAAAAGWMLVDSGSTNEDRWVRLLAAAALGLPSFTAVTLWAERRWGRGAATHGVGLMLGAVLPGILWLGWPGWTEPHRAMHLVQFALLAHLVVACLPFLGRHEPNAFWQYNRHLLERWVLAGIYAAVLFAGLALALAALDNLFGLDIEPEMYGRTWMVLTFLVHPLIVLNDIPDDLGLLEDEDTRLHGLVVLAQYVLVPLTAVYLLILLAYLVKIVATGEWPSGWIGWLVSGVATVGILTVLLVSPPSREQQAAWLRAFERWLWPALIPAALMLAVALAKRVGQYGWTEPRYFLGVLTAWLVGISLVFAVRRPRSLIAIPASLALLAALTAFGPWGAYGTSARSQYGRLEALLAQPADSAVSPDRNREIAAAVRYLLGTHGPGRMRGWLAARGVEPPALPDSLVRRDRTAAEQRVVAALGETWEEPRTRRARDGWYSWREPEALDVAGWDLLLPLGRGEPADSTAGPRAVLAPDGRSVEVRDGAEVRVRIPLGAFLDSLPGTQEPRGDDGLPFPGLEATDGPTRARLLLYNLQVDDSAGVRRGRNPRGEVLVGGG